MRLLELDFYRRPRAGLAGWLTFFVGCAVSAVTLSATSEQWQALEEQREHLSRMRAARAPAERAATRDPVTREREAKAEQASMQAALGVAGKLAIPWAELLASLEAAEHEDVAILGLTPDLERRRIRVSAEARDLRGMLHYHERLSQTPVLSEVALLNHEIVADDPSKPVRFNLSAAWRIRANAPQ